jgi:glutamine amidotransferase
MNAPTTFFIPDPVMGAGITRDAAAVLRRFAMRILVCDPGSSNVRSVVRAVTRVAAEVRPGATIEVSRAPDAIRAADVLVVPGQGSFGAFARAMEGGVGDALAEKIRGGAPYLGICLGLQVLFESSEEAPGARGLGVFAGTVRRLDPGIDPATAHPRPLPHIGWNAVTPAGASGVIDAPRWFYFAHSFVAVPTDPALVAGTTEYGITFPTAIARDRIVGVQFHPEKSQREGLALLHRFFTGAAA